MFARSLYRFTQAGRGSLWLLMALALSVGGCLPTEESGDLLLTGGKRFTDFKGIDTVETLSATKIQVSWTASTDPDVVAYNIYDTTLAGNPKLLKSVEASRSTATIAALSEGFYYMFRVRAVDKRGKEDANTVDKVGIPFAGIKNITVLSATSARVEFSNMSASEALEVNIYCKTNPLAEYELLANIRNLQTTYHVLQDLLPNLTYTCRVAVRVEGYEDNNPKTITFQSLGKAAKLVFATEPGNAVAGEVLSQQPVIKLLDENDNLVSGGPDSTAIITLDLDASSPTTGNVRGTASINAVGGIATFTDINLMEAGLKVLSVSKADTSDQEFGTPAIQAKSAQFNITPGLPSPNQSTISIDPLVPPSNPRVANGADTYTVKIGLRDQYGNPVSGIKPKFASNIVGDFLIQPLSSTDSTGQASGSISSTIADNTSPKRKLTISYPSGLSEVESIAPFVAGEAKKLAFTVQPTNSPAGELGLNDIKVSIQDQQGNTVVDGFSSSLNISVSIASNINSAVLSGTTTVAAINGVALFPDLGIDLTKTGYNLVASSGTLTTAYSNAFNITAGNPQAVTMTGPDQVLSGQCSMAITIQLRDLGGNLTKAIQNTTVELRGLGNSALYSSSSCGGSTLGSSVTFTPGTDTRTVYLLNRKVENLNISAVDTSAVLSPGLLNLKVNPSKIGLLAQAVGGGVLTAPAGRCTTEMLVTPLADDGSVGEVYVATKAMLTGLAGSSAKIYSDSSCITEVDPAGFDLARTPKPTSATKLYLKDNKGELLNLNVSDPEGLMVTASLPQTVNITASEIDFSGPATVVAGYCSKVFNVTLRDKLNNPIAVNSGDLTLSITGVNGVSTTGKFYTSASCGGTGSNSAVTIPNGSPTMNIYFKGIKAEILNIVIKDSRGNLNDSATRQLVVTPSAFEFIHPEPTNSLTSSCVGPFTVRTLDGLGDPANAVTPITASLGGAGIAGGFFADSECNSSITALNFTPGDGSKIFYFRGQYPDSLELTVTDADKVLNGDVVSWTVQGDWGWVGTAVDASEVDKMLPFRTGIKPVAARADGVQSIFDIEFSPDHQFLYLVDYLGHRIVKFDYLNNQYIGWMGRLRRENGVGSNGSRLSIPSTPLCVATGDYAILPGWCNGGLSTIGYNWELAKGALYHPRDLAADADYVYVASDWTVNRYNAHTGAFEGWLGFVTHSKPTECTQGASALDQPTPGWCKNGHSNRPSNWSVGDGRFYQVYSVAVDSTYLYVGVYSAIMRYDKSTGVFAGWIGTVNGTPTGGDNASCVVTGPNKTTPGWCTGGSYKQASCAQVHEGGVIYPWRLLIKNDPISGKDELHAIDSSCGSIITKYDKDTGAFIESPPNMSHDWKGAYGFVSDGSRYYVADEERVLKVDFSGLVEGWMGKVANPSGMSGNPGCNNLKSNDNTPGWCVGGSGKGGLDPDSFIRTRAVAYDGNGHILVGGERLPGVKKFKASTGEHVGVLGLDSTSPKQWTNDRTTEAELYGTDDKTMYSPAGVLTHGDYVYMTEYNGSRVKKFNKFTGELVGWIGGMTSKPTAGISAACFLMSGMGPSPSWCKGANYYPTWLWGDAGMIANNIDGIMYTPHSLTTDGTWLYVTDHELHRVQRFNLDDGSYGGWIGRISASPTGGQGTCAGTASGKFTPGWCMGGTSQAWHNYGYMYYPAGITYMNGSLYVVNRGSHSVSKYNASTGAFEGWMGRVSSAPTLGCTPASNGSYTISKSGWCLDGTSTAGDGHPYAGGAFYLSDTWTAGITNDGTNLYVSQGYVRRLDKYNANGEWLGGLVTEGSQYNWTWQTDGNTLRSLTGTTWSRPMSIWIDGNDLYTLNRYANHRSGNNYPTYIAKYDLATGKVLGWKGGIDPDFTPTGGDPKCIGATDSTPAWCQGGAVGVGTKLGNFSHETVGSLNGDSQFLYVTDLNSNRLIRVPR